MRSARRMTKSRSGLPGSEDDNGTSPGWRAPAGGNRHDDVGEIEPSSPRSAEHDARRLNDGRAGRRHQEVDLAGVGRARPTERGSRKGRLAQPGGDRRQRDRADNADLRSARYGPLDRRAQAAPQARASPSPMTLNAV